MTESFSNHLMPRFSFHVIQSKSPDASTVEATLESAEDAWREAGALCADMAKDVFGGLTPDSEWRIDVADNQGKTIFCLRITSETIL